MGFRLSCHSTLYGGLQNRAETLFVLKRDDVLRYIRDLFETLKPENLKESAHVQKMKKYLNFIGEGVPDPDFPFQIRRVNTEGESAFAKRFLDHDQPMPLIPARSISPSVLNFTKRRLRELYPL